MHLHWRCKFTISLTDKPRIFWQHFTLSLPWVQFTCSFVLLRTSYAAKFCCCSASAESQSDKCNKVREEWGVAGLWPSTMQVHEHYCWCLHHRKGKVSPPLPVAPLIALFVWIAARQIKTYIFPSNKHVLISIFYIYINEIYLNLLILLETSLSFYHFKYLKMTTEIWISRIARKWGWTGQVQRRNSGLISF